MATEPTEFTDPTPMLCLEYSLRADVNFGRVRIEIGVGDRQNNWVVVGGGLPWVRWIPWLFLGRCGCVQEPSRGELDHCRIPNCFVNFTTSARSTGPVGDTVRCTSLNTTNRPVPAVFNQPKRTLPEKLSFWLLC